MDTMIKVFPQMLKSSWTTVSVFLLTLALSLPIGLLLSILSRSRVKPLKWLIDCFILIMRGTPLILQLIFFYFGLNNGLGIRIDRYASVILTFTLNYSAYFSEIFRGGIQSVKKGQYEASHVLGLSGGQTMRYIVVPQVFKIVLPSITNEVITLVKDTALVSVIALNDILKIAQSAMNTYVNIYPLILAFVFYFVFNAIVTQIMNAVERRYAYYQ